MKLISNNFFVGNKTVLSFWVIVLLPVLAFSQNGMATKSKADSLYDLHQDKQALEHYLEVLEGAPNDYKALWRTSFLYSRIGNRLESRKDQTKYFNKAIDVAEQALEVDSTHTQSNFVMSVAMGRLAIISGARKRVAASRDIKKFAERAISYDSTNAGAWHVLGRWHAKVANLSWIERAAANTLFGGIPGNASTQKAAEFIEKAIFLDDRYVLYYYDLAKVYEEMDNEKQAVATCKEALELPNLTSDDESIKKDCRDLIEDLL